MGVREGGRRPTRSGSRPRPVGQTRIARQRSHRRPLCSRPNRAHHYVQAPHDGLFRGLLVPAIAGQQAVGVTGCVSANQKIGKHMLPELDRLATPFASHGLAGATLRANNFPGSPCSVLSPSLAGQPQAVRAGRHHPNTGVGEKAAQLVFRRERPCQLRMRGLADYQCAAGVSIVKPGRGSRLVCRPWDQDIEEDIRVERSDHSPRISSTSSSTSWPARSER